MSMLTLVDKSAVIMHNSVTPQGEVDPSKGALMRKLLVLVTLVAAMFFASPANAQETSTQVCGPNGNVVIAGPTGCSPQVVVSDAKPNPHSTSVTPAENTSVHAKSSDGIPKYQVAIVVALVLAIAGCGIGYCYQVLTTNSRLSQRA